MADSRRHRGANPEDQQSFSREMIPRLRKAVRDYSWLLTRGYAQPSAIKLVGDRYVLTVRQRIAVMRCSCTTKAKADRQRREVLSHDLADQQVAIDGYNVLTTVEAAIAGGVLLVGRDSCLRDMASMHGSWHKVEETGPAIFMIGQTLAISGVRGCRWLLDSPVSNSGRLKAMIAQLSRFHRWNWTVELVPDPDPLLIASRDIVATADSNVLDRCQRWHNLARYAVRTHEPAAWIVDLSDLPGEDIHPPTGIGL